MLSVRNIGVWIFDMSRTNVEMGQAGKIRHIDELRAQRYRVASAMASFSSVEEPEAHKTYTHDLSQQIHTTKQELDSSQAAVDSNQSFNTNHPAAVTALTNRVPLTSTN